MYYANWVKNFKNYQIKSDLNKLGDFLSIQHG